MYFKLDSALSFCVDNKPFAIVATALHMVHADM